MIHPPFLLFWNCVHSLMSEVFTVLMDLQQTAARNESKTNKEATGISRFAAVVQDEGVCDKHVGRTPAR